MALGYTSQPSRVYPHPSYIIPQFSPIVLLIMYSKITSCSLPIIPVPKPQFCSFCKKYYSTNLSPRNLQLIIIKLWQICKELEYNQNREKFHIHFFKRVISCPSNLHIDGIARHLGNLGLPNPFDSISIIIIPPSTVNNCGLADLQRTGVQSE